MFRSRCLTDEIGDVSNQISYTLIHLVSLNVDILFFGHRSVEVARMIHTWFQTIYNLTSMLNVTRAVWDLRSAVILESRYLTDRVTDLRPAKYYCIIIQCYWAYVIFDLETECGWLFVQSPKERQPIFGGSRLRTNSCVETQLEPPDQ